MTVRNALVNPCVAVFPAVTFNVRYFPQPDGSIWWIGKDVAIALGYKNSRDALAKHVDEEDKKSVELDSLTNGVADSVAIRDGIRDAVSGGWIKNEVTVINESGLYSLIFNSRLPQAKAFKHWVTSEVLPSIRKNGFYEMPKVEEDDVSDDDVTVIDDAYDIQRKEFLVRAWEWLSLQFETQNLTSSERLVLIELFKQLYRNFWRPVNISAYKLAKLTGKDLRIIKNTLTSLLTKNIIWCSLDDLRQGYSLNL